MHRTQRSTAYGYSYIMGVSALARMIVCQLAPLRRVQQRGERREPMNRLVLPYTARITRITRIIQMVHPPPPLPSGRMDSRRARITSSRCMGVVEAFGGVGPRVSIERAG